MTTIDRFDPFERRIAEAILEIAAEREPDYLDSVFQVTSRSRQRPRRAFPERWLQVNRLSLAAVAATLIVAIGAVVLSNFKSPSVGPGPTPTPTPTAPAATPVPAPTPIVDAARLSRFGLGRGMGFPDKAPAFMQTATWVADAEPIAALGQTSPRLRLSVDASGQLVVFADEARTPALVSTPVTGGAEELTLYSVNASLLCQARDLGRYQILTSAEARGGKRDWTTDSSLELQLTVIQDDCAPRAQALARTWTRAVDSTSGGGRGVVAAFTPAFFVTLPVSNYTVNAGNESVNVFSSSLDRTLIAVKNPTGWADPCSSTGGTKVVLPHTIDAFIGYIQALPGFTVGQTDVLTIDGHQVDRITVPTTATPACQHGGLTNGRVIEWGTSNLADTGSWFITQGDTDVLWLAQVDSDLYLLQWLGSGVTSDEEQQVLSTVAFIDALPTTLTP